MNIYEAIVLGAIQGLTEFLPISSSGHLVIFQEMLGIQIPGNDFEVLLHLGTLCSILVVFWEDIKNIFFTASSKNTQKLIIMILIGTVPAVAVGIGMENLIKELFDNLIVVSLALIFTGSILIISYFFKRSHKSNSYKKSLLIGIAQAIAIIPGVSRSGMTISLALFLGINAKQAAKFSFLLAIPVIGGAGILMAADLEKGFSLNISIALVGLFSSFLVGIMALKWLLIWLQNGKFHYFGIYCVVIGIISYVA